MNTTVGLNCQPERNGQPFSEPNALTHLDVDNGKLSNEGHGGAKCKGDPKDKLCKVQEPEASAGQFEREKIHIPQ